MEERSVTRAAGRLGMTQPALSNALARLRLMMKDQLFVRERYGIQPTAIALELAPAIAEALARLDDAVLGQQEFDTAQAERLLTVVNCRRALRDDGLWRAMANTDHPEAEIDLVNLLLSRNGKRTCVTTVDGEPMRVWEIEITDLPSAIEWDHYAELGGIRLSADAGKYSFYSTEIGTIEDIESGATIYARRAP
jgi:hypothetical protein